MRRLHLTPLTKCLMFCLLTVAVLISNDTRFLAVLALISMSCYLSPKLNLRKSLVILVLFHVLVMYLIDPNHGVTLYHYNITWLYDFTLQEALYLGNILFKDIVILNFLQYFIFTSHPSELEISLTQLKVPYRIAYKLTQFFSLGSRFDTFYKQRQQAAIAQNQPFSKYRAFILFLQTKQQNALTYRHFGKKRLRTFYRSSTLTTFDKLVLLLALFSVIISISLVVINGGRLWNPFL
ncbi:MAG: energy-coupling factor transporter transmembrane protein EcfT [Lactococcus plantarum]|nr:energy-coupling factor transporter transmembrane protein EcfT [Lactococcus plantarum]MDN6085080.1 energy-coupling factor transporter transmembrane protein EcfT [Lactococcus plantarum]